MKMKQWFHEVTKTLENYIACFYLSMYLIRTNFREVLMLRFSRFVKNREIKDSPKLGYAKIKHAKFKTLLQLL